MKKKNLIITNILLGLFILLTISLLFIDVKVIGESNKEIGFALINRIFGKIEYNEFLDKSSDVFLVLSIVLIFSFALIGLIQLIKRKSLFKVDKKIIVFGIFLVVVAVLWIIFDKFIILNYRPILIEGELEASYPSTHIMLVSYTLLASVELLVKYIKSPKVRVAIRITSIIFIVATIILRFISGMHWLTDCIGGALLGIGLYFAFLTFSQEKMRK